MIINKITSLVTAGACIVCLAAPVHASMVQVEVTNLFSPGGLALTPLWVGFHDGSFDSFDAGATASSELQLLAEEGDASAVSTLFASNTSSGVQSVITAPGGFIGAPVIEPGEMTASEVFSINAMDNGYFSFLSMLIPSNDAFIGNDAANAYALFDIAGHFNTLDILVLGSSVWDAGTEANRGYGAPFLLGADGELRVDENSVIGLHSGLAVLPGGLAIIGGNTPAGYTIDQAAADFTAQGFEVARITVKEVPEPESLSAIALALSGLFVLYRRRRDGQPLSATKR